MQHILTDETEETLVLTLSVARIPFLDFNQKIKLLKNLDNPQSLALQSIEDIYKLLQCQKVSKAYWNGSDNLRMAKAEAFQCKRLGIKILLYDNPLYPEALKQIADPPFLLFVRGNENLLSGRCLSVVGTRRLSTAGREAAKSFAYDAVMDGCNVVSGLAYGADACAHQGALNAYYDHASSAEVARTIAVLPCAIDEIVPYQNKRLAAQILQSGGCLVSEYAPGTPTQKRNFVARNRIVAGMSEATVVIEAPNGSGALITADFALEEGRDVFFHQVAFGAAAESISQTVKSGLEKDFAAGRVSKFKLENCPERFLKEGAPVIKDYKDFCVALTEMPGMRSTGPIQGELFTEI
ncbi:DNA-processing protein DprA [Treponema bryantii]|uniref:DNA-processing protein DprA n=1 Tax=Treponema bryantii TaxID=163 RepID=UPI0003B6E1DB|nr:DNA-processing protein DprA [Treponema bryantii]